MLPWLAFALGQNGMTELWPFRSTRKPAPCRAVGTRPPGRPTWWWEDCLVEHPEAGALVSLQQLLATQPGLLVLIERLWLDLALDALDNRSRVVAGLQLRRRVTHGVRGDRVGFLDSSYLLILEHDHRSAAATVSPLLSPALPYSRSSTPSWRRRTVGQDIKKRPMPVDRPFR